MCGRFTQNYTWQQVHEFLSVFGTPRNLRPRYNIAPTTMIDVIRLNAEGKRELVSMRWGLVPFFWKKTLKELPATFNARVETVAEKPMFRESFKKRRCIIPASGFFERTGPKTDRQPHLFTAADGSPVIAFAGLWDRWHDPTTGDDLLSCTILVGDASAWMMAYHDRMPVLLTPEHFDAWLDGIMGADDLKLAAEQAVRGWPVSKRLNRSGEGDDDPTILEPLDTAMTGLTNWRAHRAVKMGR
jgi:putative SOS response-associated peptidase YedK